MVSVGYFAGLFLIFLRVTAFFEGTEMFFPKGTPIMFKTALGMILALGLLPGIEYNSIFEIYDTYMLFFYCVSEVITGLMLGFIINLIFQMAKFSGSWIDIHAGFSMVSILDPTSNSQVTLIGNLFYNVVMMLFFIFGGQHLVVKALYESIEIVPLGKTIVSPDSLLKVLETIANFFLLGVKISLPVIFIIVLTDFCLGLISKSVPSIPVTIFGIPIKNVLGLFSFLTILPNIYSVIGKIFWDFPKIFREIYKLAPLLPIAFVFADDKTEEATPKKKSDARKKGQVAKSREVNVAAGVLAILVIFAALWNLIINNFKSTFIYFLKIPMIEELDSARSIFNLSTTAVIRTVIGAMPASFVILLIGIISNVAQTGLLFTKEPLKPSLKKLNPISGIKNMFSKRQIVDLLKNIAVISVVSFMVYGFIKDNYDTILTFSTVYLPSLGSEIKKLLVNISSKILMVLVVISAADYFFQFKNHNKQLKMTKEEVKEEFKQMEGNQEVKGKRKQKQREMAMQRMMQSVPDATVVITNPTHLAIALKYDENEKMEAPKVVAKGADSIALKIKEIAKENDVPIVENKPLARLMYDQVEVEQFIPPELYQGVAEVLAIVLKLNNDKTKK